MKEKLELEEIGLMDLRKIGRNIGVDKPTTLKKSELIKNIKGILNGEIKPKVSYRGRRPFEVLDLNDFFTFIEDKIEVKDSYEKTNIEKIEIASSEKNELANNILNILNILKQFEKNKNDINYIKIVEIVKYAVLKLSSI